MEDDPTCKRCGGPGSGYKCNQCGAESPGHDPLHRCGGEHCVVKCAACGQAETNCICQRP